MPNISSGESPPVIRNRYNKNIRFALMLKDAYGIDREVRTLSELKRHFAEDLTDVIEHFIETDKGADGEISNRFIEWLKDRSTDNPERVKKVIRLKIDYEKERENLRDVARKLCDCLDLTITPEIADNIERLNTDKLNEFRRKEKELREVVVDSTVLNHLRRVARNQKELEEIRASVMESAAKRRNNGENVRYGEVYLMPSANPAEFYYIPRSDIEEERLRYIGVSVAGGAEAKVKLTKMGKVSLKKKSDIGGKNAYAFAAENVREGSVKHILRDHGGFLVNVAVYAKEEVAVTLPSAIQAKTEEQDSGGKGKNTVANGLEKIPVLRAGIKIGRAAREVLGKAAHKLTVAEEDERERTSDGFVKIKTDNTTVLMLTDEHKVVSSFTAVKNKIIHYIDAGFPLIYVNTFEEEKTDRLIDSVAAGRKIFEWSAQGFVLR